MRVRWSKRWVACISVADDVNSARYTTEMQREVTSRRAFSIHSVVLRNNFVRVNALLGIRSFFLLLLSFVIVCSMRLQRWHHGYEFIDESRFCRAHIVVCECDASLKPRQLCDVHLQDNTTHPTEVRSAVLSIPDFFYSFCVELSLHCWRCSICMPRLFCHRPKHIYIFCRVSSYICVERNFCAISFLGFSVCVCDNFPLARVTCVCVCVLAPGKDVLALYSAALERYAMEEI